MVLKGPFQIGLICMFGKRSATELHPQPQGCFIMDTYIDNRNQQQQQQAYVHYLS